MYVINLECVFLLCRISSSKLGFVNKTNECVLILVIKPYFLGPTSLLSLWSNRINTANSRKHQEFIGRLNSINNKAELYQHLKEENGFVFLHNKYW